MEYGSLPIYNPEILYVIPDIHGENERLSRILEKITPDLDANSNAHLVFCGDYTNHKGPSSPKVLLCLVELKKRYPGQVFFINGNHEDMLLKCFNKNFTWFNFAENTLKQMMLEWDIPHGELKPMSYIPEILSACEERGIIDFYNGLIPYYETVDTICTHAPLDKTSCYMNGLEAYLKNTDKNNSRFLDRILHEIMWSFTDEGTQYSNIPIEKLLVCGHQFKHHKEPRLFKRRVFLDTGCGVVSGKPLVALRLPGKKILKESF